MPAAVVAYFKQCGFAGGSVDSGFNVPLSFDEHDDVMSATQHASIATQNDKVRFIGNLLMLMRLGFFCILGGYCLGD